ncbi:TonB-dependent receptor [uncultured Erythrobacter sp.]|uniref:TonB-dependent receptor plug domain-containing protein n=1 Tax=uncultured Erythrobacter sp. TaxID=263913 RepID=UPI00261CFDEC|nr:TonB-dependent receptor [uncultured Erythrobacter sp.]
MKISSQLRLSAGSLAVGLALAANPAFAQDSETGEDTATADTDSQIIVTGTRTTNPNLELSSPVVAVGQEELTLRQTNVAESFLRELPSAVPSIGSAVNNGNGGSSFVNLRGIGSQRNLVLLDGRRFVPADTTGRVDLNSVPLAVIERTDILTGGATTTYGADAVSGVVNFITRRDFAGLEANFSSTISEEGDADGYRIELTTGVNFDDGRGNAVFSIGYQDQGDVLQGDRPTGSDNVSSFSGNPGGSSNAVPSNIVFVGPVSNVIGQINDAGTDITPGVNSDAGPFNFNPFNYYQLPFERFNMYGSANYELSEALEVFSQGVFSKQTVSTQIAPGGSFFNTYQLNLNNPLLPVAIANRFCDALGLTAAQCTAAINTPDGETLAGGGANPDYVEVGTQVRRRSVEAGTRNSEFTSTLFNFVVGARGGITDNIDWEVSGTYGESERIQRQSGFARFARLQNALIAIPDGAGGAQCATSAQAGATAEAGCVPINLFGPLGTLTQDQIDYTFALTQQVITATTIGTVNAQITGDIDTGLLTSPVSFAVGAEYREFTSTRNSDEASQTPGAVVGGGGAAPDINGAYDVFDMFGELYIPLLEGVPGAESLTLELGGRYSDYSTAGTEFTWKAGGSWEPVAGLTIRGNYQRSSRAPNIGELFTPVSTGLSNLQTDPCQLALPVGNAALTAVCLAQGAPAGAIGSIQPPPAGQINVTTGGNLNLGVETADTWTVGFVAQPDAIPGFSFSMDYWNIKVEGAIGTPAVGDIINGCFGSITAASATDPVCTDLIQRSRTTGALAGAPNEVPGLILQLSNQGLIQTDGIDVSANYRTDLTDNIGLSMTFDATWTNENIFNANVANPASLNRDCVGFYSVNCGSIQPEFVISQRSTLSFDDFVRLSLRWRYLSGTEQEPDDIANGNGPAFQGTSPLFGEVDFQNISAEHYFDLTGQWDVMENVLFTLTVTNLFDNSPAVVGNNIGSTAFNSGNTYPSTYDAIGRRYSAGVRFSF